MIRILATPRSSFTRNNLLPSAARVYLSRFKSSLPVADDDDSDAYSNSEIRRLIHSRNVGILAHVDAGKTTVTERMLALAGVVRRPGTVDEGNTVTDYLPAERERGITIQSAAISFEWGWHNHYTGDDFEANDKVQVHLIDTPGHVDFSVEVNRSVAVLDGAVLVVDAVAGVQAQTETVWRAMTRPSINNHATQSMPLLDHSHEPLPCLALINKMDKEGRNFGNAIMSLKQKLPGANPIAVQMPLFRYMGSKGSDSHLARSEIVPVPAKLCGNHDDGLAGDFVGIVDLVHMRAIIYPEANSSAIEDNIPTVIPLLDPDTHEPLDQFCNVTNVALAARADLIAALANVDEAIEEYFLLEEEPTNAEIRAALRRATLGRRALPVMAGAALKGRGIEPLLDSIADLLPSPLDRLPPALIELDDTGWASKKRKGTAEERDSGIQKKGLGHPLYPSLLALAFKVVHMKGRGGSGDGRVVFARVYSGQIQDRDQLQIISPPAPGETAEKPRIERVGGMLELAGGRFDNLADGICKSGDVCALVGLRTVVTGDTITIQPKNKNGVSTGAVCLAGVSSPKPVLTVRVEAESSQQQKRLSEALSLLVVEDPSIVVQESDSATLVSGLGELHIEVILDRLSREFGLEVTTGKPAVAYRESLTQTLDTGGFLTYDRTIGNTRLQAGLHLILTPKQVCFSTDSACAVISEPRISLGREAREFLGLEQDMAEEDVVFYSDLAKTLILGCQGALRRGPIGSYALANVDCHVVNINAEGGPSAIQATPGALRAAASHAIWETLVKNKDCCVLLEPSMSVEVIVPNDMVGTVLSDLNGRRGTVGDVIIGSGDAIQAKALVRGEVPLVEILGYANTLRSITGGEGSFTAEYKGHSPCDKVSI